MRTTSALPATIEPWESLRLLEDQLYRLLKKIRSALDCHPANVPQDAIPVEGVADTSQCRQPDAAVT